MSNNKSKSSSPWILSWLSQLTNSKSSPQLQSPQRPSPQTAALPWNSIKPSASPITITKPVITAHDKKTQFESRPSITISLSSERRDSQQTMSSSLTTSDAASYYQRRDSSERSILSDLWSKAKQKNRHPLHKQDVSCPVFCQDHVKRHSMSSTASRPNSIIVSQPSYTYPHLYLNNYQDFILDDDIDTYWLNNDYDDIYNSSMSHYNLLKKDKWMMKHELIKLAVDGLFAFDELVTLSSSIEKYVLQIGCGDALWGIDIALQNPKWMVIGIDDVDKPQPSRVIVPRNFKFIQCQSLLQALSSFSDATFDLIESRFLVLENTNQQYRDMLTECLRLCKPNGYIQVMELDMRIYHQKVLYLTTTHLINNEVMLVLESKGLDPRLARHLKNLIVDKDSDVSCKSKYISLPLGVWGGRLGLMFRDDVHRLFEWVQKMSTEVKQGPVHRESDVSYQVELLDNELEANRSFMNVHVMLAHKHQ